MKANNIIVAILALVAGTGLAEVVPLAPIDGATVALVPDAQKKVMSLPTLAERLGLLDEDKTICVGDPWRKSVPFVLKWRATEGERAPWKVEIGKAPDLSDARTWFVGGKECNTKDGECSYAVPMANLEIAREYHWRITGSASCGKTDCGRSCRKVDAHVVSQVKDIMKRRGY